jgi:ariadne-1
VLDAAQCKDQAARRVLEVAEVLACDLDTAQVLLRHYKWDKEKLTDGELPGSATLPPPFARTMLLLCLYSLSRRLALPIAEYMTDPEKTAAKVGIHLGADQSITHMPDAEVRIAGVTKPISILPKITCSICFETKQEYSALACGHAYCNACYKEYISHKIADEGHDCVYARCPFEKARP